eukprot:12434230-Alexandrium_andersonii.AAC.1
MAPAPGVLILLRVALTARTDAPLPSTLGGRRLLGHLPGPRRRTWRKCPQHLLLPPLPRP